jgi:flagellar hook-associated protein 1 FlgK
MTTNLSTALNAALSGLRVSQAAISVTSTNIGGAGSPDYSRRILNREAVANPILGVQVTNITRAVSDALRRDLEVATGQLGRTGVQDEYLGRLQSLFGVTSGSTQLSTLANKFEDAWRTFEASPEDAAAARNVTATGEAFARHIRELALAIEAIDNDIRNETESSVDRLNGLLVEIDRLNDSIVQGRATGESTVDLEDRRDALVRQAADLADVRTSESATGALTVFTSGGLVLVDTSPATLSYDGTDITIAGQPASLNSQFREGRVAGLLALRADSSPAAPAGDPGSEVIRKLREQLDALASEFLGAAAGSFATAYDSAATGAGELGSGFFGGSNRFDLAVDASLLNGTLSLKRASAEAVGAAMADRSRAFSAGGLALSSVSYAGMAAGVVVALSDAGAVVHARHVDTTLVRDTIESRFQGAVGVNIDEELANLQLIQNAYAASARVMTIVQSLFDILNDIGRG